MTSFFTLNSPHDVLTSVAALSDRLAGAPQRFDTRSRGRLSQTSLVLLTQASCYRFSAMEVMHKLINSTAHFVRCVRSNGDSAADTWDTGEEAVGGGDTVEGEDRVQLLRRSFTWDREWAVAQTLAQTICCTYATRDW